MKKTSLAALALCAFAGVASANPLAGLSGDIGIGRMHLNGADDDATQVRATVSYVLAPNWAADVMGSTTWSKGGATSAGYTDGPYTINGGPNVWRNSEKFSATTLGLYARPHFQVTPNFEVYGRAGVSHVRVRTSDFHASTVDTATGNTIAVYPQDANGSANKTGFSYGYGVKGTFGKNWTASLDYMNYYDKNGIKLDGLTLSTGYAF